jgi:hypothetical protein
MGKYGTDYTGFGAYEGGVNSDKGANLIATNSDGETSLLFGAAALREIQAGIANGDFAISPDAADATISDSNPLPYWTFIDVNSAGAITCAIVEDSGSASGNILRWSVAASTTTGKSATLTRYIPVPGSRSRSFAVAIDSNWRTATASTVITATVGFEFFDAGLTSAGSGSSTTATFTTLGASYDLQAPEWLSVTPDTEWGNTTVPTNAAFVKLTITIATTGTTAASVSSVDLSEIRLITGGAGILLPDLTNPNLFSTGGIFQDNGSISIMPVVADTLSLYGRIDVSPNVVITAPQGLTVASSYSSTGGDGTIYAANLSSENGLATTLQLKATGSDVIVQDINAANGTNPRILMRAGNGTTYAGIKSGAAAVVQILSGTSTTTYGQLWAARIYPMNGSTASRYIYDDGTYTHFTGAIWSDGTLNGDGLLCGAIPTTTATTNAGIWVLNSGTNYTLRRNTSSARYKTNIVDADHAVLEAARKIKPRHYESTIADEAGATRLGFIAEEVLDAGLSHAVGYDAEGRVDTIDPTALIAALYARVNDLEERLAALESR